MTRRWRMVIEDLRVRAERCLASAAPTPAEAHELAVVALEIHAWLRASMDAPSADPYRGSRPAPHDAQGEEDEASRVVALERALEACQMRLHVALAKLTELEGSGLDGARERR